jgi:hypothetical protein
MGSSWWFKFLENSGWRLQEEGFSMLDDDNDSLEDSFIFWEIFGNSQERDAFFEFWGESSFVLFWVFEKNPLGKCRNLFWYLLNDGDIRTDGEENSDD